MVAARTPERAFGFLKSAPDARDFLLEAEFTRLERLPEAVDLRGHVIDVLDQGRSSACVAHAVAQALRVAMHVQGVARPACPSRRWIYYQARRADGEAAGEVVDAGTRVRAAFKACHDLGFPPEALFPWNDGQGSLAEPPPFGCYRTASAHRLVSGYYRIASVGADRVQWIKHALSAHHPVSFGVEVDEAFERVSSLSPWSFRGPSIGGHAMCLVGYDAGGALVCNSWGRQWGENGFGRIAWETLASERASDFWVPELVPGVALGFS